MRIRLERVNWYGGRYGTEETDFDGLLAWAKATGYYYIRGPVAGVINFYGHGGTLVAVATEL